MRFLEQRQEATMMLAGHAEHRALALGRGKSFHVKFYDRHRPMPLKPCSRRFR